MTPGGGRKKASRWHLEAAGHSDVGLVRSENEDAFGVFPNIGLYLVADGVGGHAAGQVASNMVVETLRDALSARSGDDLTPVVDRSGISSLSGRLLTLAIEDANARVRKAGKEPAYHDMGSTVAAVAYDPGHEVIAISHVGDSRVFRYRGGVIEQLTDDHTLVQQLVRDGAMTPEDASASRIRNVITQAVGTQDIVKPSLRLERPDAGDVFVLTSDGVHDVVEAEELATVVREGGSDLARACVRLTEMANERGGRDNATAVMVLVLPAVDDGEQDTLSV